MILKDFIECIDPKKEGIAWVNMYEGGILQCKFNSASSFIEPLNDKKVIFIEASEKNVFIVDIEKEPEDG